MEETQTTFTVQDFENISISVTEIQQNALRLVHGEMINSLPMDMELQLSKFVDLCHRLNKPYIEARKKHAAAVGYIADPQRNGAWIYTKPPGKDKEEMEAFARQSAMDKAAFFTDLNAISDSVFTERDELFAKLPLSLFTEKRLEESGIIFKNCPNRQWFLKHCVVDSEK